MPVPPIPNQFLGPPITGDYMPRAWSGWVSLRRRQPAFHLGMVEEMLTDPRLSLGLWMIKGVILSRARFFIDTKDPEIKDFLASAVTRFWRNSAARSLQSIEWGFSCNEVLYEMQHNKIHFNTLKSLHPMDCRALTWKGKLVGAKVYTKGQDRQTTLPPPRVLWNVHERLYHRWYGRSRLRGAYLPWIEKWDEGGYRDSRALFAHKYAYEGGILYHPVGSEEVLQGTGNTAVRKSYKEEALSIVEKKRTGGVMAIPNVRDPTSGNRLWEYESPTVTPPPAFLMEHGKDLNDELLEAIGVPPEIVRAEGTGAYAGRKVPEDGFYAILQEGINWLISDSDEQIFRPLVLVNFGPEIEYEIIPFGLLRPGQAQEPKEDEKDQRPLAIEPPGASINQQPVVNQPPKGYRVRHAG